VGGGRKASLALGLTRPGCQAPVPVDRGVPRSSEGAGGPKVHVRGHLAQVAPYLAAAQGRISAEWGSGGGCRVPLVYPQGLKHSVADRPLSCSQHVFDQQPVYSTQRDQTFQRTRYPPRAQHKWRRERPGLQSSDNMRRNSSVLRHIARWDWERPYDQSTRRVRQEHPTATQTGEHASKRVR